MDDTVKHGSLTCIGRPPSSRWFPPREMRAAAPQDKRRPPCGRCFLRRYNGSPLFFGYRETRHRSLGFLPRPKRNPVTWCERVAGLAHAAALAPAHVSTDARSTSFSEPRTCGASCPMCPYHRGSPRPRPAVTNPAAAQSSPG
jgi:hypothetical protein